jgi:hypothetical protein
VLQRRLDHARHDLVAERGGVVREAVGRDGMPKPDAIELPSATYLSPGASVDASDARVRTTYAIDRTKSFQVSTHRSQTAGG